MVSLSLYVHIPFCTKKCPYCHFYVVGDSEPLKEKLIKALHLEWQRLRNSIRRHTIVSVYFGGGTPTLFGKKYLEALCTLIATDAHLSHDCEWTIEANPESCTKEDLLFYRSLGINRISFGVQSFSDTLLHQLGRTHSSQKAKQAVSMAEACGFNNCTIDLMYELPNQSIADWKMSLEEAVKLPITHLSLYNLTIEPHTAFAKKQSELEKLLPSADECLLMYEMAIDILCQNGFSHYEISAFCRKNLYSRHNTGYWTGRQFLGLGPSAFSFFENERFQNSANLTRYANLLQNGQSPVDYRETITQEKRKRELFVIGLRLLDGSSPHEPPDTCKEELIKLQELNLIELRDNRFMLTRKGILFYDTVASELI